MRINNLRYNARVGAFEASVDIMREGRTFRYPCELQAPQQWTLRLSQLVLPPAHCICRIPRAVSNLAAKQCMLFSYR